MARDISAAWMCVIEQVVGMTHRTKLYIAGAMRHHKTYNAPAFDSAASDLRVLGFDVVNPVDLDRKRGFDPYALPEDTDWSKVPTGFDLDACAVQCIQELAACDGIFMLHGWQRSKGALAELAFAEWTGKLVIYQ